MKIFKMSTKIFDISQESVQNFSNIYTSAIFPYYLLKFFGLFPSKLTKNATPKIIDKIYIFIVLALHILLFCHSRPTRRLSSLFIVKVWELNAYLGFLLILFLIFYQYWKNDKIMEIFGMIDEFDEKAKVFKIHINNNSYKQKSLIYIIISFLLVGIAGFIVLYFIVDDKRVDNDIFTATFYYLCLFYSNAAILQFCGFAIAVRDRMNLLHQKMSSLKCLTNFEVALIIELYEKLFKSLEMINKNCTTQLIPITLNLLMNLTFSIYAFGAIVFSGYPIYSMTLILLNISMWLIEHASKPKIT